MTSSIFHGVCKTTSPLIQKSRVGYTQIRHFSLREPNSKYWTAFNSDRLEKIPTTKPEDHVNNFERGRSSVKHPFWEFRARHYANHLKEMISEDGLCDEKFLLVAVSHLVPDVLSFFQCIQEVGNSAVVLAKGGSLSELNLSNFHSINQSVYKLSPDDFSKIKKEGFNVNEDLLHIARNIKRNLYEQNEDEINDLVDFIKARAGSASFKTVVIFDVGGYFSNILDSLYSKLQDEGLELKLVLEDTENGLQRYEKSISKKRPPCLVLSVARSVLKQWEDNSVGISIEKATDSCLRREFSHSLRDLHFSSGPIIVIGYGKIGAGIVRALELEQVTNILVIEKDFNRLMNFRSIYWACPTPLQHEFVPTETVDTMPDRLREALQTATMIFSATGQMALTYNHLAATRNNCVFASSTSRDDEYGFCFPDDAEFSNLSRVWEDNNPRKLGKMIIPYRLRNSDKIFYFVADGNAPNLAMGISHGDAVTQLQFNIILALATAVKRESLRQKESDENFQFPGVQPVHEYDSEIEMKAINKFNIARRTFGEVF